MCIACSESNSARQRRFKFLRDLAALQMQIGRKLDPGELMKGFEVWYLRLPSASQSQEDARRLPGVVSRWIWKGPHPDP